MCYGQCGFLLHVCIQHSILELMKVLFLLTLYRGILTHLQQTTFENIVTKGKIAHDEQFLLWPQGFQLYLTLNLSFINAV